MGAIRVDIAFAIGFLINPGSALHFAFGTVSVPIGAANRRIVGGVALPLAVVGRDAAPGMTLLHGLAPHQAFVVVGDAVRAADGDEGFGLGAAAVGELPAGREAHGGGRSRDETSGDGESQKQESYFHSIILFLVVG